MTRDWVVLLPGVRWDDIAGTDQQLARALGRRVDVLWVDPAYPLTALARGGPRPRRYVHEVADGVHRLQPVGPPGGSRPGLRQVSQVAVERRLAAELAARDIRPLATVMLSTRLAFPTISGRRIYYVTDDWVAGAAMMGLSPEWITTRMRQGLASADLALAVTPDLADVVAGLGPAGLEVRVLPNGANLLPRSDSTREGVAGVVGQLNERLDYDLLGRLADQGVRVRLVGPRTVRDPAVAARLDALVALPGVEWTGPVPFAELPGQLGRFSVGLTPYLDTAFNRSSFPLKTLEYLGAGLPVVSTDLPAAHWLDTEHVAVAAGPDEFVARATQAAGQPWDEAAAESRRDFARGHSWDARAGALLDLCRA